MRACAVSCEFVYVGQGGRTAGRDPASPAPIRLSPLAGCHEAAWHGCARSRPETRGGPDLRGTGRRPGRRRASTAFADGPRSPCPRRRRARPRPGCRRRRGHRSSGAGPRPRRWPRRGRPPFRSAGAASPGRRGRLRRPCPDQALRLREAEAPPMVPSFSNTSSRSWSIPVTPRNGQGAMADERGNFPILKSSRLGSGFAHEFGFWLAFRDACTVSDGRCSDQAPGSCPKMTKVILVWSTVRRRGRDIASPGRPAITVHRRRVGAVAGREPRGDTHRRPQYGGRGGMPGLWERVDPGAQLLPAVSCGRAEWGTSGGPPTAGSAVLLSRVFVCSADVH